MTHDPISWNFNEFTLSTDKTLLQVDRIHHFLSKEAYWCLNIPLDVVEKAISNSLCFGLYDQSLEAPAQIGFARVVTDTASFAWLCDVYVESAYRGKGLSKWMIKSVMTHKDLQGLRRICLTTRDAHGLYEQNGFQVTQSPTGWMEIKDNDIYTRLLET